MIKLYRHKGVCSHSSVNKLLLFTLNALLDPFERDTFSFLNRGVYDYIISAKMQHLLKPNTDTNAMERRLAKYEDRGFRLTDII
jgi:hypothetical protein